MNKEEKIISVINKALEKNDYDKIYSLKDDMFFNYEKLKNGNYFDYLIVSTFYKKDYSDAILITEELLRRGYETSKQIYYCLLSCLANNDIYRALSIIKRSKVILDIKKEEYLSSDSANYSNILKLLDVDKDMSLALLIANIINSLLTSERLGAVIDYKIIIESFFTLIDQLYELGYSNEIIEELNEKALWMFME